MASDHFVQRVLQRCAVEIAFDAKRRRDVICRQIRIDLLQVPQPSLGKRQRQRLSSIDWHDRRDVRAEFAVAQADRYAAPTRYGRQFK